MCINNNQEIKTYIDEIGNEVDLFLNVVWVAECSDDEENYPGEQSIIRKMLSNKWSDIVQWSIEIGNHHFAITINIPQFCNGDGSDPEIIQNFQEAIKISLGKNYPTLSWCFFVTEKSKNGQPHFHLIVAIRNFIDYNYTLKYNISYILIEDISFYLNQEDVGLIDLKIDSLMYFKDIKNWVMYMHKDITKWKYKGYLSMSEQYYNGISWKGFDGHLHNIYDYYIIPNDYVLLYMGLKIDYFLKYNFNNNIFMNLNGIRLVYNKIDQRTLINILQYYLILNEYFIYNDNIYVKIKDSKISYKLVGGIKEVLYDKFQENVVKFYLIYLSGYFEGFDFSYLMDTYFVKTKNIIESIKDISTQRIEPDFGLIEFTDGVYSIKYDRFFSNKDNYDFINKISTIKYYDKSYSSIRQNKPNNWIKGVKNALGVKNDELTNEDFLRVCFHILSPVHKDIFNKRSTLFIHGQSNTGKTTLVANVVTEYYESNNVGSIVSAKNFKWQDLIGKIIGIIDEGRYNSSMSSDLLKITGQEKIIVEKKYSKEHITIDPIPLIILSNILFEDKNISIDKALKNRLYIIEFINKISKENLNNSKLFKDKLKSEEANIIIYCNKLLFKLKGNNLNKISNKVVLKLIKNEK